MEADDIERYLAELGAELKNRGIKMIVLYCSRKHKFGQASKPNNYWINISHPKDRRKTPNVLRILFTGFLRESEVDHEV